MRMKMIPAICACLTVFASSAFAATPIAQWKLDEGTGTVINDSVGSYTGTLNGGTVWEQDAPANLGLSNSLHTDGTSTSYGDLGTASSLCPSSITLGFWAKATAPSYLDKMLVSKYASDSRNGSYELGFAGNGSLMWRIWTADGGQAFVGYFADVPYSESSFRDGLWHFLAGTYDQPTGVGSLYVDGSLIGSQTLTAGVGLNSTDDSLYIGKRANPGGEVPSNVDLSYISIYGSALSSNEINELAHPSAAPVPEPGSLVALAAGVTSLAGLALRRRS